jgi:hypothetical protein
MPNVREQLDYLLAVDRLISAADEAREKRDRLLRTEQTKPVGEQEGKHPGQTPAAGRGGRQ